jgi:hypothetical protein
MGGAVVDDPEHPGRAGVGLGAHHLVDQLSERTMPVVGAVRPSTRAARIVGGQMGQRAAAAVLELGPADPARRRRQVGMAPAQALQLSLLIGAAHVLVVAQRLSLPDPGVEVEHWPRGRPEFRGTSVAARCASGCDDLLLLNDGGDSSGDLGVERGTQSR